MTLDEINAARAARDLQPVTQEIVDAYRKQWAEMIASIPGYERDAASVQVPDEWIVQDRSMLEWFNNFFQR